MAGADDDRSDSRASREQLHQYGLMLSSHEERLHREQQEEKEQRHQYPPNPLSGFKRTVDGTFEALGGLLRHTFAGRTDEMAEINRRWTGSEECEPMRDPYSPPLGPPDCEVMRELMTSIEQSIARNEHIPYELIHGLYRDPESAGSLHRANRWLSVEWFKRNPYSPIRLEAHPQLGQAGTKWREAFEELMNASLGKPIDSRDSVTMRNSTFQPTRTAPGLDWMFSLQSRGILPPLLPTHFGRSPISSGIDFRVEEDADFENLYAALWARHAQDPNDELEMYEALERDTSPEEASENSDSGESSSQAKAELEKAQLTAVKASQLDGPVPPETKSGLRLTGDQQEDFDDANDALWEALWAKNVDFASRVLSDWHKMYDSVEELVDAPWQSFLRTSGLAPTSEWFSILTEALRQSQIPEDDVHKDTALSAQTKRLEQVDRLPIDEKRYRYDMRQRVKELLSDAMNEDTFAELARASTSDLEEFLERLEQENDNLEAMFAGRREPDHSREVIPVRKAEAIEAKQPEAPLPKDDQPRKPDVLSILSTTQTTRLPDGTVTTKVVLKKRFADGREESTESTHTRNEFAEENAKQQAQLVEDKEEKKSAGWFWS
ncbi:unnamed protein product [Zymoseptoria tritici ST99CH_1A5]|uniref:Uncharacterized protein n=2 Tax=Zymoseptoria tritici TaxID=1047171 RepID=A0A1X7S294_ZYMT9|nr:unnamed protein product [Zymoseptoria tritici ST99CH_3D7]SMR60099.1 unnamed protein product [Zymoseptoria tritici ST99CH_3D1]SMY27288.1 unnamed protein product [Zymoseptoria tritici ST99CH_1A5]